ncbi:MAG TPA: carbohydrate ABC transporter permease [Thermomicrobiales bacterium]|nr:carbohydrate ABC transporter permease [Thermomicrobiales bacterium]
MRQPTALTRTMDRLLVKALRQERRAPSRAVAGIETVGRYVAYLLIVVVFLGPFLWMFTGSVRQEAEIHGYMFPLGWHTIVPVQWTLKNFADIFGLTPAGQTGGLQFQRGLLNSALVSVAVVCCSLFFNTMAAYFFTRLPFPGKRFLFVFVIATFMLPSEVTIVPLYLVVHALGLVNTYWALIVPFYSSPFIVFMMVQFLQSIPRDLDEAALVDGANYWQILWRVVFPNAIPALATGALIEFQNIWNLFYWPLIAVSDPKLQVLQVMIASQTSANQVFWGRTFAGMVTAVLPVLLLFLACQRFYFRGAVLSGLK